MTQIILEKHLTIQPGSPPNAAALGPTPTRGKGAAAPLTETFPTETKD